MVSAHAAVQVTLSHNIAVSKGDVSVQAAVNRERASTYCAVNAGDAAAHGPAPQPAGPGGGPQVCAPVAALRHRCLVPLPFRFHHQRQPGAISGCFDKRMALRNPHRVLLPFRIRNRCQPGTLHNHCLVSLHHQRQLGTLSHRCRVPLPFRLHHQCQPGTISNIGLW